MIRFKPIQTEEKPKDPPKVFLEWIRSRMKKNLNAIIMFNGSTGSGKSYACLRLAIDISQMMGTTFTVKNNLGFKFKDLLQKMQLPDNQRPGVVFIQEEIGSMGSGGSSREWQSESNKFFFSFLQTNRCKNQIVILNCPSFSYLEKGSRELVHFEFESLGVDHVHKLSFFKPFAIQCNRRTGKLYFKYLRYNYKGSRKYMNKMKFGLPPTNIIRSYEKLKLNFVDSLNQEILNSESNKPRAIKKEEYARRKKLINVLRIDGKPSSEIADLVGITQRSVQRTLSKLRNET